MGEKEVGKFRKMKIAPDISAKISNMGIICAFMVLFIHLPKSSPTSYVYTIFSHGLCEIAVPFFFAASGYLLAGHFNEDGWYGRAVVKRVRTLYVPMVIWCLMYFLWTYVFIPMFANVMRGGDLFANVKLHVGMGTMARLLALHPFAEPYLGVLWFVKTLLVFVLLSPLLKRISTPVAILVLYVMQLILGPYLGGTPPPLRFTLLKGYFPICGSAFFCLGMMLRIRNATLELPLRQGWTLLGVGLALMFLSKISGVPVFLHRVTFFYIPILLAGIWSLCPSKRLPGLLTNAAFGVYLMHMFAILFFLPVFRRIFDEIDELRYVLLGLLCFGTCVGASWLARKLFPNRLHAILFGGR